MKKARKKRIARRKRRISEREIMRIKRKLKKSARKLRLGAKRTGAYVYGTLRRIVGNPMEKMGIYAGRDGFEITDFKRGDRIQLHPGTDLWMRGAKYGQIIGIGRKKLLVKLDYLRRPIAISPRNIGEIMYREIGENRRRTAGRRRIVRVLGYDVVEGSKKHMRLLAQKRHFDDLQRSERGLRGNPGKLFPASYPPEKKLILFLARREGWKKYKVSRTGTYPFELRIDGVGKNDIQFSGLLKLIAIHSLVNWTSPQVAMMSSYPSMAREGDWSGIRDSSDEAIDNIFYNFVLKPLGIARPVSR